MFSVFLAAVLLLSLGLAACFWNLGPLLSLCLPLELQAPDGLLVYGRFEFVSPGTHRSVPRVCPADRQRWAAIRHMQHSGSLTAA